MVSHEASPKIKTPETRFAKTEIPKSTEIYRGDINDAVITVQQITGFEITPDWWMAEVGNDGPTEDILKRFDTAFEKFVHSEMGLESPDKTEEGIIDQAGAEISQFDEQFADDPDITSLRTEFIDALSMHLKNKYFNLDHDAASETNPGVTERPKARSERNPSTKKRVKSAIEALAADSDLDTKFLDGVMATNPERDREDLPNGYVEHKAERTAIAAAAIKGAMDSLVEVSTEESDDQPAFTFKFVSRSEKPDKVDGLFDDIEELFKVVGQQTDKDPGDFARAAGRYTRISENLKGTTFPQTVGEAISQGGPTLRTVFEDIVREVQSELSNRVDLDKESRYEYALSALKSALKIRGFNLGHVQVALDTPSQSLKEYIHKGPSGVTVEGLPPRPESGLYGETLGCPASLAVDDTGELTMLDVYAQSVAEALIEREIV